MGELEKLIDNLIRDVKDPKMKKDLIGRLKAAQSKEQPLDDLTDGKLEEIEKLKKKLNKVSELNKSLVTVSKKRFRSTGSPLSGGGKNTEDSRLLSTGAGTGWKGFSEKPKVRSALPKGTEKKPAETFAVSSKQPYGGKAPLSRTVSTGVKRDDPDTQGVKDRAAPIQNTSTGQTKPKESKPKESKSKKFLNRLLGRGKKEDKPLTSSTAPTPTSTETSRTQSGAIPKPDDKTSQTATASTSQIKEEEPKKKKKEKKQESNADALKKLKREHEAAKKKREALFSGKKVEKPKEKKGKKTISTADFTSEFSRGAPSQDEVKVKDEVDTSKFVSELANKPSVASGFNRRNTRRKKKSLIKAMEEFLEKDALTNRWTETIRKKPTHNAMVDSQSFTRQQTGARYDQDNANKRSAPNSKWDKLGDLGKLIYQEIMDNEGNPTGKYAKNQHAGGSRNNPLAHGNKERQRIAASKRPVPLTGNSPKDLTLKKALDILYKLEKDASGYGDLGIANVYPLESYNEPSLIGEPVGEIESPSNISETYIVSRENKGKENEQDNKD
jgi:hypothetical protein